MVQSELDLQRDVSQKFAPVAAQTVAWTADKLGNIQNYERVQIAKANLQEQLKDAQNPEQIAQLQQQLALADQYLSDHQTEYNTWKEGGIGRAALHAGVGALLTGDAQGAVGAGTSSLAAPYLNQVGDKFGGAGKLLTDTLGGAAIGALTGGSTGAAVAGANADWFNRQLHPDERNWIRSHAAEFAGLLGITPEEAEKRLSQQAARQTDLLWMLTLEKVIDEPAQQFLAQAKNQSFVNENNKKQTFFTTQGKQFLRPEYFADKADGDIGFYRKNLISRNNSDVTTGAKQLARKFGQKVIEDAKSEYDKFNQGRMRYLKNAASASLNTAKSVGASAVKSTWNCVANFNNCTKNAEKQVREHFVETGEALGTGGGSLTVNDLKSIYGQDMRGAQAGLWALHAADGLASATGAAKALNLLKKGSIHALNAHFSGPLSGSKQATRGSIGFVEREAKKPHDIPKPSNIPKKHLEPGTPEHKQARWKEYQENPNNKNKWDYERWSKVYDANITKAKHANSRRDAYHKEIGWGETEQTVQVRVDGTIHTRRHDIADIPNKKAVEHKTGYQSLNRDVSWELDRDKQLVKDGWKIEWVFEGNASKPLVNALKEAGISVKFINKK